MFQNNFMCDKLYDFLFVHMAVGQVSHTEVIRNSSSATLMLPIVFLRGSCANVWYKEQ